MEPSEFKYRVVLFTQPGCAACNAMKVVWQQVAGELADEYPEHRIGFGEMNVQDDNWEFLESLTQESGQGTPEIAVFDEECDLIGFNGEGIMAASQLKDFILSSIQRTN
jgi:thiol-disulfide isomerase/thioredoxin